MNTYTVTLSFSGQTITKDYPALYSLDAHNTAIDDAFKTTDLINEKGDFKITCVLKSKGD